MSSDSKLKNIQIVGIDFGTTNSTVSYITESGFPQLIPEKKYGKSLIPTAVAYKNGNFFFGQDALNLIPEHQQVWLNLKRELGAKNKKYKIKNKENDSEIEITSQDLIVKFLDYLKKNIQQYLQGDQFAVVISSPAYFNQDQKAMLQNCFTLAGFDLISLIAEPTGACISYSNDNFVQEDDQVMVFDVGGGTTDVAMVKITENNFSALPTSGNSDLGGADFDNKLVDKIIEHLQKVTSNQINNELNDSMKQYIFTVVENCKKELSKHLTTKLCLSNIIRTPLGQYTNFEYTLTRKEFEEWTRDLVDKAMFPVTECLNYNKIPKGSVKKVLMIGGGSQIWGIKARLQQMLPSAEIILDSNAKYCVSKGDALFGNYKKDFQKSIIIEKINKSIGVVATDPNNANEPMWKRKVIKIIHRGDDVPAFGSYTFRTSVDNQKDAEIILCQGEGYTMENCKYIGTVTLDNIGVAKAGINKITVELKVNDLGLLSIAVQDNMSFRKEQKDIIIDHNWTTADFINLQKARKTAKAAEENEVNSRNWTKYVKWYNTEYTKLKEMPSSPTKDMMQDTLAEFKQAIKEKNWKEVEKLQKKFLDFNVDLNWNN